MGGIISKKALNEEMKYVSLGEEAYWSVKKTSPIPPPLHAHTHTHTLEAFAKPQEWK